MGILALDVLGYKVEYLRGLDPSSQEARDFFHSVFEDLYIASEVDNVFYCTLQTMVSDDPSKRPSIEIVEGNISHGINGHFDRDTPYLPSGKLLLQKKYKRPEPKSDEVDDEKLLFVTRALPLFGLKPGKTGFSEIMM